MGKAGWIGIGWPGEDGESYGNRRATLTQQVVWAEEYARSGAPARMGHIGENLLAPTLITYGTEEQKQRHLPPVARGETLWCQGYSEPGAGSDLAGVRTAAVPDGAGGYAVTGQKIWTSLALDADWCFVLARTDPGSTRHHGLSFLLVEMDQPGRIEVRPIRQLTGTSEFNEVFLDGARAAEVVGGEGNGWQVAMGLLALERGVSTLAQQIGFGRELDQVVAAAVASGAAEDPVIRARLVRQWAELDTMRRHALRTLGSTGDPGAPSVAKLLWGGWHQRLGELAVQVAGEAGAVGPSLSRSGDRTNSTTHSTCSSSAGPTPSTAAPTRSSGTSSPSGCSAYRGSRDRRRRLRRHTDRGRGRPGDTGPGPRGGAGGGRRRRTLPQRSVGDRRHDPFRSP